MKRTCRSRARNAAKPFYTDPAMIAWMVIAVIGLLLVFAITGIS